MRYNSLIFIFCLSLCTISSCAQGKYGIKKIQAFSKEQMPGNIRVAREGDSGFNGPDTIHIVYIETNGKTATWETAWWNNKEYSITVNPVSGRSIEAGKDKATGKSITITRSDSNKLWVLYLTRSDSKTKTPVFPKKGEILLKGKYGTRVVTQLIKSTKMLETLPSV